MPRSSAPQIARELGLGFLYWLAFLLVLEPGNLLRAANAGRALAWDMEALRIFIASLLGASATPVLMVLIRRFPIEGPRRWRNTVVHTLGSTAISVVLIVLSCLVAAAVLPSERRTLAQAFRVNLIANGLLLVFCMAGLIAIMHAARFLRRLNAETPAPSTDWLTRVAVSARGRTLLLDVESIDWIEAQGNYLALHAGATSHLIRDTITAFAARLDPDRFVRIHRGAIVAIDRIVEVEPLGGGDATIRLRTGAELRLSRSFRSSLAAALVAPN
ncbi:MAG: LytTR family DNA-binding domain-containing protein [Caulobacter sp.]|nr:LytTR family DNA-binding domain-containing protein [Caulobacter sp.]